MALVKFLLGIVLFDNVEVLDFAGPFEVFSTAGNLHNDSFKVVTLAQKDMITALNGLKVVPDYVIGNEPKLDILLIPGGPGTIPQARNKSLLDWIKSTEPSMKNILSVCTGIEILAKLGFIDGMVVTTARGVLDDIQAENPAIKLSKCHRFTDNGKFLTSAGVSAGIDLSFYFVKKTLGIHVAKAVAKRMEYDWKDLDANCP